METAASLTNHLVSALRTFQSDTLSTFEISKVFENVQRERQARVEYLIKAAHARQRLECMDSPLIKLIVKYVVPRMPRSAVLSKWIDTYSPAVSLNMLPLRPTRGDVPYYDERFRQPSSRGILGVSLYAAYFLLAWLGYRQLWAAGKGNGTWQFLSQALQNHAVPLLGETEAPLRRVYTGLRPLDAILQTMVTFFLPVLASSRPEHVLQTLYFLATMAPLIAIFTVEGFRSRNKWTLLATPSVWAVLYQLRGIGLIAPLYMAVSTYVSSGIVYFSPSTRNLSASTARAILPALVLGYVVPTMLMFFPLADALHTRQLFIALWQPAPVYVTILTRVFSRVCKSVGSGSVAKTDTAAVDRKANRDIPHLQTLYAVAGCIAACFHLVLLLSGVASGTDFITKAFIPFDSFAQVSTLTDGVVVFFQNDFLIVAVATLLWCLASMWDLHRLGISNISGLVALPILLLSALAFGPGATVAAVWYWREQVLSRTSFPRHASPSR